MPIYTCTVAESTLATDTKRALAVEIARIHSSITHVPSTYVNVAFHELAADGLYTDGVPANPVLVTGWVREGHPADDTTRLATEISTAVTKICEIDVERVLVVIQPSPARFAVEGGRVLPEPGQENAGSPEVETSARSANPDRLPTTSRRREAMPTRPGFLPRLTVTFSTGATPPQMHLLARRSGEWTLCLRPS